MPSPEPGVGPAAAAALADWLSHAERLHVRSIDLSLDRMLELAGRLDIALRCPTIVVAGTNGKGSTCALLDAILRAAGYRCAMYTSPHLLRFNERARLGGLEVDDRSLVESLAAVESARGKVALTYFEFTTLAILHRFARLAPDVAVLEIGLGGRLDAVNLVDADCAVLTSVDLDHTELLGSTREQIGFEKAHIFRPGRPAICSDPLPPATVPAHAAAIGADFWLSGKDFSFAGDPLQWNYRGRRQRRGSLPLPALRGVNQLLNAAGVLAALESLDDRLTVSQQAVREGLLRVDLPARFQVLPGRPTVVLDVAHNPHAASVLARNLDRQGYFPTTHAVFAMLADKDRAGCVDALGARVDHWFVGPTTGPRGSTAADLARIVRERSQAGGRVPAIEAFASVADAYRAALEQAGPDDRIVVFGSFLTVSDVMRCRQ